jgi:hypothetical protein
LPPRGVKRPRRVVRFARLMQRSFRADADRLLAAIEPMPRAEAAAPATSRPAQVVPEASFPRTLFRYPAPSRCCGMTGV